MPTLGARIPIAAIVGGGFTPLSLPNLQVWLRADKGVYQDTAMTTPSGDGDVVGGWQDQSGQGNDATQGTTAQKPTYRASQINGRPAVDPDGTADNLILSGISLPSGSFSIYVVVDLEADDLDVNTHYIFDTATGRLILGTQNTVEFDEWAWFDDSWHAPGSTETPAHQIVVWVLQSGGNGTIYRNNTSLGSAAYTAKAVSGVTRLFRTGGAASSFWTSPIAEIVIYTGAHDDTDRGNVQGYLSSKYGVALS